MGFTEVFFFFMEIKGRQRRKHTELLERRLWISDKILRQGAILSCLVLWRRVEKAGPRRDESGSNEVPEGEKQLGEGREERALGEWVWQTP